jgi:hypothetical protein
MEFGLAYDDDAMTLDEVQIGTFLEKDGGTAIYIGEPDQLGPDYWWLVYMGILEGPAEGVSGSGTILTLTFQVHGIPDFVVLEPNGFRGPNDEFVSVIDTRGVVFLED